MKLTWTDLDVFVAAHEFNEIGDPGDWFRLTRRGYEYVSHRYPWSFFRRRFDPGDIIAFMTGFNETEGLFQYRPVGESVAFS